MSPKLYCAIPNSYVVNGATELKGKYVKIISVNDWSGSIINVKVSNYGNGSYFYIILCLATNNIVRWVSGKLIAGNISGFSFYRVDKSIYMFIPDSIQDLYVTLDASMGNVSYGKEYENTIDLSNPITISWHNSLSTLDLGGLLPLASITSKGLISGLIVFNAYISSTTTCVLIEGSFNESGGMGVVNLDFRPYGMAPYSISLFIDSVVRASVINGTNKNSFSIYYLTEGGLIRIKIKFIHDGPISMVARGNNTVIKSISRSENLDTNGFNKVTIS